MQSHLVVVRILVSVATPIPLQGSTHFGELQKNCSLGGTGFVVLVSVEKRYVLVLAALGLKQGMS